MKIALCMSGHARTHMETYEFWRDNLMLHHDVDVFFHLWDTLGPRQMGGGLDGLSGVLPSDPLNRHDVERLWQPKQLWVDSYAYFHERFRVQADRWYKTRFALGLRDIDRPLANFSMYYKWWACNDMKNRHAEQHNIQYDMVIRTRPDIALLAPLPETCFVDQSKTYVPIEGSYAHDEISDYIVIGTNEQINHWCNIYDQIDLKYDKALADGDFTKALYPHKLFYYHFVEHNQPFESIDINCKIFR